MPAGSLSAPPVIRPGPTTLKMSPGRRRCAGATASSAPPSREAERCGTATVFVEQLAHTERFRLIDGGEQETTALSAQRDELVLLGDGQQLRISSGDLGSIEHLDGGCLDASVFAQELHREVGWWPFLEERHDGLGEDPGDIRVVGLDRQLVVERLEELVLELLHLILEC